MLNLSNGRLPIKIPNKRRCSSGSISCLTRDSTPAMGNEKEWMNECILFQTQGPYKTEQKTDREKTLAESSMRRTWKWIQAEWLGLPVTYNIGAEDSGKPDNAVLIAICRHRTTKFSEFSNSATEANWDRRIPEKYYSTTARMIDYSGVDMFRVTWPLNFGK